MTALGVFYSPGLKLYDQDKAHVAPCDRVCVSDGPAHLFFYVLLGMSSTTIVRVQRSQRRLSRRHFDRLFHEQTIPNSEFNDSFGCQKRQAFLLSGRDGSSVSVH